jgi:hypothetical protein
MQFTQRSLARFKQCYQQRFGEELSDEVTRRKAEYLLEVYRTAYNAPNTVDFFYNKKEENMSND